MTGTALKKKLSDLYGDDFYPQVAEELDVDKSTVYRWINLPKVPGVVAAWIGLKLQAPNQ